MSRILIVDDSLLQRKMLSSIVVDEGYEAQTASDGQEGLNIILAQTPDCVILDMLMPEMTFQEFEPHISMIRAKFAY